MRYYVRSSTNLHYVQTPDGLLGPLPKLEDAMEIMEALRSAEERGAEEIRAALREVIGVKVVHVGD